MLTAPPLPIPNPQLVQAPIAVLLAHFATALQWLTDAYGLVQTGTLKDGKGKMPQLYAQNGDLYSLDVYPDERMAALSWFERDGAAEIEWEDALHLSGHLNHSLALVVWCNLPLIDPKRGYDFSDALAADVLRVLVDSPLGGDLMPGSIEQRAEQVFRRYNFPQEKQQLLMYPYSGFRIPFTVRQSLAGCPTPFAPLP